MGLRWAWRAYITLRHPVAAVRLRLAIGSARKARKALAAWTPPAPLDDVNTNTSGIFNPHMGLYGVWPQFHYTAFGTLVPGAVGDGIGYFRGILFWRANQQCRPIQNPGPHNFTSATATAVRSFKAFFGISTAWNSNVDTETWYAIQWLALYGTNRSL